jgi:hypothetical protein
LHVIEGGAGARTERGSNVVQEAAFFLAQIGAFLHCSAEVVDFPVGGNCKVERVLRAVDEHHSVFASKAIGGGGVEILDRKQRFVRQSCGGFDQVLGRGYAQEILAGVKTWASQPQREAQLAGVHEVCTAEQNHARRDDAWYMGEVLSRLLSARGAYPRWMVDDGGLAALDHTMRAGERLGAGVGVADGID